MEFQPIMRALWRNRTGAILVALQIALALAIVVNSMYIIVQRLEHMGRDPGLNVADTFTVFFAPSGSRFNPEVAMRGDIDLLRSLPGVVDATRINSIPLSGSGSSSVYYTEPGEKGSRGARQLLRSRRARDQHARRPSCRGTQFRPLGRGAAAR